MNNDSKVSNGFKNFIKAFLISCSIPVIITILGLLMNTAIDTYYRFMKETENNFISEYHIEKDITKIITSSLIRGLLSKYLLPKNTSMLDWKKDEELKYYENIKRSKIPKDDLLLDYLEFRIEKGPNIKCGYHDKEFDNSLLQYLDKFKNKKSVIKYMNEEGKYEIICDIITNQLTTIYIKPPEIYKKFEEFLIDIIKNDNVVQNNDYSKAILLETFVIIAVQEFNNADLHLNDPDTCTNPIYIKSRDRILKIYSYISQMKRTERLSKIIEYLERLIDDDNKFKRRYCRYTKNPSENEKNNHEEMDPEK
jgi:hypothetical protein